MTKIRESLAEAAGTTCIMGGSTECPWLYPATEPIRHWGAEAPMLCAYHAATEPLAEEADALAVGLDLFEDWEAAARQHGDNEPLLDPRAAGTCTWGVLCTPGACQQSSG